MTSISYKEASALLFINSQQKSTHTFLGCIGANWDTSKLRRMMRKSKLYFSPTAHMFGGHHVHMVTPEGRCYWLETADAKVKKYMGK